MKIKYWWSPDSQWFCILTDDGASQTTVSLSREEAKDLSSEADPEWADMLLKGREKALELLKDARTKTAGRCHLCNQTQIDGCFGGSLPDRSRCRNLMSSPATETTS